MSKRPNIQTLQREDTIARLAKQRDELMSAAMFASKELRAWFGNFNADALERMRADFVRVADRLDAAIGER